MSKIREILTPMLIESQKQSEREWMMVRVVQAVGQLDINLDLMRQCVQSLLSDCDQVLNRKLRQEESAFRALEDALNALGDKP